MRLSELLRRRVVDNTGERIGYVQDVRTEQDGQLLGDWGAALTVKGLLVTPRHWLSTLGYEAGHSQGPWLVRTLTEKLHRRARFIPWDVVVWSDDGSLSTTCGADDLPFVNDV